MPLSREDVLHIASLCRIGMDADDVERMRQQLSHILDQFEVLKQADTAGVSLSANPSERSSVFRDDVSRPSLSQEDVLRNAPQQQEGHLRVKAILED
ncbi:MAG: Asp-tRNA(Asn)/Glu-tRNA(Gln) amidotransferase subunit GatC [Dehalococcoidia bacterium]|nr:Asp-tRNA(Asn)/Glu-tRNA(Gln) amidotransferase subunit GatC [Dehalococcoidia bacterium]